MENPWLKIPYTDYENHMMEVGQAQVLSELTKICLEKYRPENFMLLGCATGNGLEHIDPATKKNTYAIDINPDYLTIARKRFQDKIKNLITYHLDIERDDLPVKNIDLCFIGLVLEYVTPKKVLPKIIQTLSKNGIIAIVIQQNAKTSFVTKTKYKSLEQLSDISSEVNEVSINEFMLSHNFNTIMRDEIRLTKKKSFIVLVYKNNIRFPKVNV